MPVLPIAVQKARATPPAQERRVKSEPPTPPGAPIDNAKIYHIWSAAAQVRICARARSSRGIRGFHQERAGADCQPVMACAASSTPVMRRGTRCRVRAARSSRTTRGRAMATDSNSQTTSMFSKPWTQLVIGIICMVMVANLQYGWTLFVGPIGDKYHWTKAAIQVTFTIFVLFETWLVPAEGYLVDRFGPKWIVVIGGALCGVAWTINSFADSLAMFYFAGAIGGVGAGAVYGTCIGNAVRWFP